MIRFLLRSLGFVLMAATFVALVVDGTRSIAGGRLLQYPLGDALAWFGGTRSALATEGVARAPAVVGHVVALLLAVPGWMVGAVLGLSLLYAGRPARSEVGLSRRRA